MILRCTKERLKNINCTITIIESVLNKKASIFQESGEILELGLSEIKATAAFPIIFLWKFLERNHPIKFSDFYGVVFGNGWVFLENGLHYKLQDAEEIRVMSRQRTFDLGDIKRFEHYWLEASYNN